MNSEIVSAAKSSRATSAANGVSAQKHRFLAQYEQACGALTQCSELVEVKAVADKAEALAALAKIYGDGGGVRQAKILKLRAYRRMGEMAREISAQRREATGAARPQAGDGAHPILRAANLSRSEAKGALSLSNFTLEQMRRLESRRIIPSVTSSNGRNPLRFDENPAEDVMSGIHKLASSMKRANPREFKDYASSRVNRGSNVYWRSLSEEIIDYLQMVLGTK